MDKEAEKKKQFIFEFSILMLNFLIETSVDNGNP